MFKKSHVFALATLLFLSISTAYADIASDMEANLPLENVIQNALDNGATMEDTLEQMITISPDSKIAIFKAATALKPDSIVAISQMAISAGVDPSEINPATAAPSIGSPVFGTPFNFSNFRRPQSSPSGGGGGVSPS